MANLQVNQIRKHLTDNYIRFVDASDIKATDEDKDIHILSRAYAAYAVVTLGNYEPQDVCACITDEYEDNGIDLVYIDNISKKMWIVQSKFSFNGNKSINTGDIHKFIQGIEDLCNGEYNKFGVKIKRFQGLIDQALCDAQYHLYFVIAYTRNNLSKESLKILNPFIKEFNESGEISSLIDFNLAKAHDILKKGLASPIDCQFHIKSWGQIVNPYKAIYGIVDATEIAQLWEKHGISLLSKNIRHFLGNTESNNAMNETLNNSPELFKYFNNGISILCDSINKTAFGGTNTDLGIFGCTNIQIVNGAQTVGTIGEFYKNPQQNSPNAEVFVKIISLEGAPSDFSKRQTIANNTQNKVEKKDFVSLCPIQLKLKEELRLDGINYHLKRGIDIPSLDDNNYTFDEAAIALAASQTEVTFSVQAKREVGKLWESLASAPYTELFNESLTPTRLKHILKINRAIKCELDLLYNKQTEERSKRILILGNIFITHLVMQKIKKSVLENKSLDINKYINETIKPLVRSYADITINVVNQNYSNSNIPQLFRNFRKCRDIKDIIINIKQ